MRFRWLFLVAFAVAVAAAVGLIALHGRGLDRGAYLKQNIGIIESLPVVPGAVEQETTSTPIRGGETVNSDVIGYVTTRVYKLAMPMPVGKVVKFFDSEMKRAGWQAWHQAPGLLLTQRKGDAYVAIYGGVRGEYRVQVEHDCFKGGDAPRCFSP